MRPAGVAYLPASAGPDGGLLVAWRGETVVGAAARIGGTGPWVAYDATSRGYLMVDDEDTARHVLAGMPLLPRAPAGYERDDPETGAPLPLDVEGYHLGRRY